MALKGSNHLPDSDRKAISGQNDVPSTLKPDDAAEKTAESASYAAVSTEKHDAGFSWEEPPEYLSTGDITNRMLRKIDSAVRAERNYVFRHAGAPEYMSPYLKGLHSVSVSKVFHIPETTIAFLSSVSGGKSSLLNIGICKYPILPVAGTETSTCVVEIRHTSGREDEHIEVCALTRDKKALESKPFKVFRKQVLEQQLFEDLLGYAKYLIDNMILSVDDGLGFFFDEDGNIRLQRTEWRHCMTMFMTVLDAYIHQDLHGGKRSISTANEMRNALLSKMGIPLDLEYGIRLYWNSEFIPEHSVLVDLPGTGGTTVSTDNYVSHTDLVSNYLSQAASLICLFNEEAQMNSETRQNLSSFIESNSLKGASSAHVNFVLNKADIIDEKKGKTADQTIITTIENFRINFPYCQDYPIYTLSTYDGEIRLLDNGISLQNLHQSAKRKRLLEGIGMPATEETLFSYQQSRYQRAYPCQMRDGDAFGTQTFSDFVDALVSEYITRIHFLQTIQRFREHIKTLTSIADVIKAQQDLLELSQAYSPELAKTLIDAIDMSMRRTINELDGVITKLQHDMGRELNDVAIRMNIISEQFTRDYKALSQTINTKIANKVNCLERQNGNIPIDGNIVGTNSIGLRNRDKMMSLGEDFSKIDFMFYFRESFRMLRQEFQKQRGLFDNSLNSLCTELEVFPDKTVVNMRKEFEDALSRKHLGDVPSYQAAMKTAEETTLRLLRTVCEQYVTQLKSDMLVEDTLNETANRLQRELNALLNVYTEKNFGWNVIANIQNSFLFRANTINPASLSSFLTKTYITDFEQKMVEMLKKTIGGSDGKGSDVKESHIFRMSNTIKEFYEKNLSSSALDKMNTQVQSACSLVDAQIQDPMYYEGWRKALTLATSDLEEFFSPRSGEFFPEGGSAYATLLPLVERYTDADWASEPVKKLQETAQQADKALTRIRVSHTESAASI